MMTAIIVLIGVFALGVHFGRTSFTTSCGSQVWVSWDHGGQFPVEAYANVNEEANEHLKSLLKDRLPMAECFVVPSKIAYYKVIFWAGHPLRSLPSDVQSDTTDFVQIRLAELAAESRSNDLTKQSSLPLAGGAGSRSP